MSHIRYLRRAETLHQSGLSSSTLYARISDGLFVPPVSLGGQAVGWLEHEVNQVLAAMAAGQSRDEVRALVRNLVEQRKQLAVTAAAALEG